MYYNSSNLGIHCRRKRAPKGRPLRLSATLSSDAGYAGQGFLSKALISVSRHWRLRPGPWKNTGHNRHLSSNQLSSISTASQPPLLYSLLQILHYLLDRTFAAESARTDTFTTRCHRELRSRALPAATARPGLRGRDIGVQTINRRFMNSGTFVREGKVDVSE